MGGAVAVAEFSLIAQVGTDVLGGEQDAEVFQRDGAAEDAVEDEVAASWAKPRSRKGLGLSLAALSIVVFELVAHELMH